MTVGPARPALGAVMLLIAATIWGLGFLAQKVTVVEVSPLWAVAIRFLLAAPLAVAVAHRRLSSSGVTARHVLVLGVVLLFAFWLQTIAVAITPVSRVSLITGLYSVIVPFLAPFMRHPKPTGGHWLGAGLAFAGACMLTGMLGVVDVPLNRGDLFTFMHAFLGALHVLLVAHLARTSDPLALNALQLVVVALLSTLLALWGEGLPSLSAIDAQGMLAFGYLAILSTVVAFALQIFGQRHTSPPTAAVLMMFEAPVGVLAAVFLLGENLSISQGIGALVLLCGVSLSLFTEFRRR